LLFAVREGQLDTVRLLIEAGADPNEKLPDGSSALVLAATNANYELGLFLVDKGADPNAAENGWTALHTLSWVRHPNFGFNPPGPTVGGNIDSLAFAKAMVARGANVNARITKEVTNGYRNALNRLGATPLLMAARLADVQLMRALVALGADPKITTEDNATVLQVAAGVGIHSPGEDPGTEEEALACVKYAIELGGDPNAADDDDDTPLHGAAYRGAPSIVQYLVDHGANTFDKKNIYGWTPLRIADGVYRTATYKESAPTAALLRQLMAKQSASATTNR
jgi:ankyrin repeat protein